MFGDEEALFLKHKQKNRGKEVGNRCDFAESNQSFFKKKLYGIYIIKTPPYASN
jgi:hypothetical protein